MKMTVKDLSLMALYLAMFIILDVIANKLPKMPQGGSIGLGIIALLLASYHLGWRKGLIVSFGSVLLQFMTGQMYIIHPIQFVLDYVVAFGIYGIASLMPMYVGIVVTNTIRYVCSVISGVVFFGVGVEGSVLLFSLGYNAWYMVPTLIICLIAVPIVYNRIIKPQFNR